VADHFSMSTKHTNETAARIRTQAIVSKPKRLNQFRHIGLSWPSATAPAQKRELWQSKTGKLDESGATIARNCSPAKIVAEMLIECVQHKSPEQTWLPAMCFGPFGDTP